MLSFTKDDVQGGCMKGLGLAYLGLSMHVVINELAVARVG